jgi:hypothetical protein
MVSLICVTELYCCFFQSIPPLHCTRWRGENPPKRKMADKEFAPLSTACARALNDRIYEKRKTAALEIEKMVRNLGVAKFLSWQWHIFSDVDRHRCDADPDPISMLMPASGPIPLRILPQVLYRCWKIRIFVKNFCHIIATLQCFIFLISVKMCHNFENFLHNSEILWKLSLSN